MRKNSVTKIIMIPSIGRKIPEQANHDNSLKSWSSRCKTSPAGKELMKECPFFNIFEKIPVLSWIKKDSFVFPRQRGRSVLNRARKKPSMPRINTYLIRSCRAKLAFMPSIMSFNI